MSTNWAIVVGVGSTIVFIILCLALFGWLMGRKPKPTVRTSFTLPEEPDTLIPEAEALHNAPSPANPEATLGQVVNRARAKTKAKPKKPKAPTKPKRTPKTRRTRFDRIDDD